MSARIFAALILMAILVFGCSTPTDALDTAARDVEDPSPCSDCTPWRPDPGPGPVPVND